MIATRFKAVIFLAGLVPMCGVGSGCRWPHLLGPTDETFSEYHRAQAAYQAKVRHDLEMPSQPAKLNAQVSSIESQAENQSNPAQTIPSGWDAVNFVDPQVTPLASTQVETPPSAAMALAPTTSMPDAPTALNLALASYTTSLPAPPLNAASLADKVLESDSTSDDAIAPVESNTLKLPEPNVELQIENVRPQRGKIKVAVFTDADNFLNPEFVSQAFELSDTVTIATASLSIDKPCAIAVFQDIDGNGQLTQNRLGIPIEPCGFSNNVVIKRGPPKFSEAMVPLGNTNTATPTRVSIRLP